MVGYEDVITTMLGPSALAMIGALIVVWIIVAVGLWVYTSLAWMTIGKKLKYKNAWIAWIPIVNIAMVLQLGEFHWAWIFLALVPVVGWLVLAVMAIIATWRIYVKRKYAGWLSLISVLQGIPVVGWVAGIVNLIILGLVAWKDK
jgi:hypothetical protein